MMLLFRLGEVMRGCRPVLLAVAVTVCVASSAKGQIFTPQVVTAETIARAGLTRLSDVLWYVDGLRPSTTDGFTTATGLAALAPPTAPRWHVFVDGQPVEAGVWGASMLNALPVSVEVIDRVEVAAGPAIVEGRFVDGGVLHVYTDEVEGADVEAAVSAQNETGDPGPYRYTPESEGAPAPNVDSHGPDGTVTAGIGSGRRAVRGTVHFQQHFPTDPALLPRFEAIHTILSAARTWAASGRFDARLERDGQRHAIQAGATRSEAFPFIPALGREASMRYETAAAGVSGAWEAGARRFDYRAGVEATTAGDLEPEVSRIPVDWRERRGTAAASIAWPGDEGTTRVGVSGEVVGARSDLGLASGASYALGRLYAVRSGRPGESTAYETGAVVSGGGGTAGFSAFGQVSRRVAGVHEVDLRAAFRQVLPPEQDELAWWMRQGFLLHGVQGPVAVEQPEARRSAFVLVEGAWRWEAAGRVTVRAGGVLRHDRAAYIERRRSGLPRPPAEPFTVAGHAYARGTAAALSAGATATWFGGVQEVAYDVQVPVGGEEAYRDYWAPGRGHQASLRVVQPLPGRLAASGRVLYAGPRRWPGYGATVPGFVKVDAAFHKRFAGELLDASVAFENLLDDEIRYHPLGATFDLSVRVRVAVRI